MVAVFRAEEQHGTAAIPSQVREPHPRTHATDSAGTDAIDYDAYKRVW